MADYRDIDSDLVTSLSNINSALIHIYSILDDQDMLQKKDKKNIYERIKGSTEAINNALEKIVKTS